MDQTKDKDRHGYKPALLRGRQFIELDDTHLVCIDGENREKWRIAWTDISALAFVDHAARGARMSRLDIMPHDGQPTLSISCNSAALDPMADPEFIAYRATVSSVCTRLGNIVPDLPVTVGEYGRTRMWMFIIGVVSIVFALGIAIAALAGGRGEALAPVAVMLIFGLVIAWANAPWRPKPRVPVALFAKAFADTDASASRQ